MLRTSCRHVLAAALLTAAFTGCVSSVEPLSDAKTSLPDLRLLGDWEYQDGEGSEKVKLNVALKKGAPKVLQITADDGKEKETADLFLTKIGNDHFASVENEESDGKKRYLIARYELLKDGTVRIWVPETDFFAKAVEDKKLKGQVNQPNLFKDVALEDTAENVRNFLKQHGMKCFGKETDLTIKRAPKSKPATAVKRRS